MTCGIIDATDYIDKNTYSNDEYTQFMNQVLVNSPNGFAPSYDIGVAVEWEIDSWSINGVGMNVGENDDGNNYNFFAVGIGYAVKTFLGEGNYRLIGQSTSEEFLDKKGTKEKLWAVGLSFDQELGDIFGGWIRLGWQDDKALVDYDYILSGGLNIAGKWYGRENDNIGLGYAYMNGLDNSDFYYSQVAEVYWRFLVNDYVSTTVDFQYMADVFDTKNDDIDGFIFGIRGTVEF